MAAQGSDDIPDYITTERDLFWAAVKEEADVDGSGRPAFASVYVKEEPVDYDEVSTRDNEMSTRGDVPTGNVDVRLSPIEEVFVDQTAVKTEPDIEYPWGQPQLENVGQQDPLLLPENSKRDVKGGRGTVKTFVAPSRVKEESDNGVGQWRLMFPTDSSSSPSAAPLLLPGSQEGARGPAPSGTAAAGKLAARERPSRAAPFVCNVCEEEFRTKSLVRRHIFLHCGYATFTCAQCAKEFACERDRREHHPSCRPADKEEKPFASCGVRLGDEATLAEHARSHPDGAASAGGRVGRRAKAARKSEKLFSCDRCGHRTADGCTLRYHMRTHTGERPHPCRLCAYRAAKPGQLARHMHTHSADRPHACPSCSYRASTLDNLKLHVASKHRSRRHKCDHCDYRSAYRNHLATHLRTHTGERPFACAVCEYSCTTNSRLKTHMRSHTGEKPHACTLCAYRGTTGNHLKAHVRTHTGEKPYGCDKCAFRTIHRGDLVRHARTHTGETPYGCDKCGQRFKTTGSFNRHASRVHGDGEKAAADAAGKPCLCSECGVRFADRAALARHATSHGAEKPHGCDQCEYRCAESGSMKRHALTHTGEKPFECEVCGRRFTQVSSMKTHLKRQHPDQ